MTSLYTPPAPSRLMTGTIENVEFRATGNPRYTVNLRDANHLVPVPVYAWAAAERYYPSATQQYDIGDSVIVQDNGGAMSILRPTVKAIDFEQSTDLRVGLSSVHVDRSSIDMGAGTGQVRADESGALVAGRTADSENYASLHVHGADMRLHGREYGIQTMAAGVGGLDPGTLILGGRNPQAPFYFIPVMDSAALNTIVMVDIPHIHSVNLAHSHGEGSMPLGEVDTTDANPNTVQGFMVRDIAPRLTNRIAVDSTAVSPATGAQPRPVPDMSSLPGTFVSGYELRIDRNGTVSHQANIGTTGVSYTPESGDRVVAYYGADATIFRPGMFPATGTMTVIVPGAMAGALTNPETTLYTFPILPAGTPVPSMIPDIVAPNEFRSTDNEILKVLGDPGAPDYSDTRVIDYGSESALASNTRITPTEQQPPAGQTQLPLSLTFECMRVGGNIPLTTIGSGGFEADIADIMVDAATAVEIAAIMNAAVPNSLILRWSFYMYVRIIGNNGVPRTNVSAPYIMGISFVAMDISPADFVSAGGTFGNRLVIHQ